MEVKESAAAAAGNNSSSPTSNNSSSNGKRTKPLVVGARIAGSIVEAELSLPWKIIHRVTPWLLMTWICLTAIVVNVFQVANLLVFGWWNPYVYRIVNDFVSYFHCAQCVALLEVPFGMKVRYYGKDVETFFNKPLGNAILISNHLTYADWPLLYALSFRVRRTQVLRIFLKDLARLVPGPGWGCWMSDYFLVKKTQAKGEWSRDGDRIVERLKSYKALKNELWATLFPEGTFHDGGVPDLVQRTQAFARENKLPVLDYLLTPRTRGFLSCATFLRGHVDYIVDTTLVFSGNVDPSAPPSLQFQTALPLEDPNRVLPDIGDLCGFRPPKEAHLHIR